VKSKNKFYVHIPPEVAESLAIKEGEELDVSKRDSTSFVVSKKGVVQPAATIVVGAGVGAVELNGAELELLKKLDTMRYNERTKEKVDAILTVGERAILSKLMERKFVTLYRKDPKDQYKYGIAKSIYERFLMGKRVLQKAAEPAPAPRTQPAPAPVQQMAPPRKLDKAAVKRWEQNVEGGYIEDLETKGYVVLKNEAEAASASAALEDSIKQGLVIGTRAFDKRFYIGLRGFINKNGPKIMKVLERGKSVDAETIAAEVGIDVDAVKTILYILAEKGDVTEVRREIFRMA
jgi:transcription initiation factor IIE alpha subunit